MRTGILLACLLVSSSALTACKKKNVAADQLEECRRELDGTQKALDALTSRQVGIGPDGTVPATDRSAGTEAAPPAPDPGDLAEATDGLAPAVEDLKPGATYRFTSGNQTVVLNPKPVDDGLWRFRKGDTCRFDPDATMRVVGKHAFKEDEDEWYEYLVRYKRAPIPDDLPERIAPPAPLEEDSPPYQCPDGTVFFLDDESVVEEVVPEPDAAELEKIARAEREWMERLYETARKMLQDEPVPGTIKVHH